MFLIDYGTPDLFKSHFEIIHKSAFEQVTGYQRYRNTLLLYAVVRKKKKSMGQWPHVDTNQWAISN